MAFRTPSPGYNLMQLPQQAQQKFQQAPGMTPVMSQNLMAAQQAQQQGQQQQPNANLLMGSGAENPLAGIKNLMNPPAPANPMMAPLSGSMANPAASNQAAMSSYDQIAKGDMANGAQSMLGTGALPQEQSWWKGLLGGGAGGGWLSGMFG